MTLASHPITHCENCGSVPDTSGHEDKDSPYLVKVWSIKRQEETWVCYGCFIAFLDSDLYRKVHEVLYGKNDCPYCNKGRNCPDHMLLHEQVGEPCTVCGSKHE